ncbi:Uncharacterized conserved protein, UPF0335 family [Xaviernesmea oryzae]|uniref:UPF0335 protein SAMN02982989_3386 n=1 Tax=Xaviernesmea oryzae TaxID=464029 RepID=A0A1X7G854_9HYPH|nr:Uncharacterized conserved protein, UPF0335 family [Xaviernesmea oryzae]
MTNAHGVARDQLRAFIERIERLEEEKKTVADDIKDVYGEAKAMGYDTKIMKKVIALRKKDEQERTEEEMILDSYLQALGMIPQFEMFEQDEVRPSREERRRQIMSEDMDDHKALIDEMADAGLISEDARAENKALADAVATKFGNGRAKALQSPRKAAEAVSERTATPFTASDDTPIVPPTPAESEAEEISAIQFQAKASGEQTGGTSGHLGCQPLTGDATRPSRGGDTPATNSPETAEAPKVLDGGSPVAGESRHHCDVSEDEAGQTLTGTPNSETAPASQGEAEAPSAERVSPTYDTSSAAANAGGDHVTAQTSSAAKAGAAVSAAPAKKTIRDFRPHCLRPQACGSSKIDEHCYSCRKSMEAGEAA